jgi:hypothetical protein
VSSFLESDTPKIMSLFDFYIMVDWSGAARRRGGRSDTIPFNALREVARIGERCEARSIGHYHLEAARMTRSIAHRREAAARNMAQEAARNTRTGQGRSGDRQRNRIRRRGQQKAVGP